MKNITVKGMAFALLLFAGTPVMAENPADPAAPGSNKSPGVTPTDAKPSGQSDSNPTGAQPNTNSPTMNTPGATPKN